MFKRREPYSRLRLLREMFWPSMGWTRSFTYIKHRIIRLSDSTHNIARGLSVGAAISFTPLVGTHFIQAGVIAWMLRGNLIASLVGTFVGNPWTFPFMWYGAYKFGVMILSLFGFDNFGEIPEDLTLSVLWSLITDDFLKIFLPWMLGGYLLALITCPVFYVVFFYLVGGAKRARALAKQKRLKYKTKKDFYRAEHNKRGYWPW